MTVTEVLVEARRRVRDVGWVRSRFIKYQDDDRNKGIVGFCIAGSMFVGTPGVSTEVVNASFEYARLAIGLGPTESIMTWNDREGRTREEVVTVLDAAIELAQTDEKREGA